MAFDKARHQGRTLGVNEACFGAGMVQNGLFGADRDDPVAAHGERFGSRAAVVHGQHAGVHEDQRGFHSGIPLRMGWAMQASSKIMWTSGRMRVRS